MLYLLREGLPELLVRFQNPFFEASETLVQGFGGQKVAVEAETVEDEKFELGVSVRLCVFNQFAVKDGFGVERGKAFVILFGEM